MTFIPLYQNHPDIARLVLCDTDPERLARVATLFGVSDTAPDLQSLLDRADVDAIHLVTPMQLHAEQSVAVLDAGKHCACAVPAAVTLDELREVVAAEQRSGRNYMMMETAVYTREFLFAADLVNSGQTGRVQFLRGAHYSDYESWPSWNCFPPMLYATHAVAPLLRLAGTRAASVRCLGSGVMPRELAGPTDNPFPVETALFSLADSPIAAEVSRSIFRTARQVQESFNVYGEMASFEWAQVGGEDPVVHRVSRGTDPAAHEHFHEAVRALADDLGVDPAGYAALMPAPRFPPVAVDRISAPPADLALPTSLRRFAGHGGAEAHLVHEFVRSMIEGRLSAIDSVTAADWTAPGICAHQSALQHGAPVAIPAFDGTSDG
jgi:predicted dehydrogenase